MRGNDLEITVQNLIKECKKQWRKEKGGTVSGKVKLPKKKNSFAQSQIHGANY